MMTFRKLQNTIVGTIDGKPFNIIRTLKTEEFILKAQKEELSATEVMDYIKSTITQEIASSNKYLSFNPITKQYFLTIDGFRSSHPIPNTLVKFIEESFDKDIDFTPVLKAWARLLTNPRYNNEMGDYFDNYLNSTFVDLEEVSRLMKEEDIDPKVARSIATYQDIAITQEGLLATYKVADIVTWEWKIEEQEDGSFKKVKNDKYKKIPAVLDPTTGDVLVEEKTIKPKHLESLLFTPAIHKDGDKFYSGNVLGYVYKVGEVQKLPKTARRNLNNTFGGGGLYSGGLNYIDTYKGSGSHVLTCFVNPSDILSFQAKGKAFRTDALMPYNVWDEEGTLKGKYHSSDYGKQSEERVAQLIKDAVNNDINIKEEQIDINTKRENGDMDLTPDVVKEQHSQGE